MHYGELDALARFGDQLTLRQFGRECFIRNQPTPEDVRLARDGWGEVQRVLDEGAVDLLILDEIGIALHYGLVSLEEVQETDPAAARPGMESGSDRAQGSARSSSSWPIWSPRCGRSSTTIARGVQPAGGSSSEGGSKQGENSANDRN